MLKIKFEGVWLRYIVVFGVGECELMGGGDEYFSSAVHSPEDPV